MSGMEFISEAVELTEGTELSRLLEEREALQGYLEDAQKAGNVETATYFRRELARLEDRLAQQKDSEFPIGTNRLSTHQG